MFQGNLKGFSRKFKRCFKGVLRVFQGRYGSFMSVSRLFQGSLKHIENLSKNICFVVVVAASRAEGGLVLAKKDFGPKEFLGKKNIKSKQFWIKKNKLC